MEMFRECGWPAFAVAGLGVLAVLIGILAIGVALFRPRAGLVLGVLALAVSCAVPAAGVGGTMLGRAQVDDALSGASVDSGTLERLRTQGHQEAAQCTTLGVSFGALPLAMSLVAIGVGARRKRRAQ